MHHALQSSLFQAMHLGLKRELHIIVVYLPYEKRKAPGAVKTKKVYLHRDTCPFSMAARMWHSFAVLPFFEKSHKYFFLKCIT